MGKKYIIELNDECNSEFKGIMVFGLTQEKQISVELIPEESMTHYTEDTAYAHGYTEAESKYREIRDELEKQAYQRGYQDATVKISSNEQAIAEKAYQQGLNDAWEAARKVVALSTVDRRKVFGSEYMYSILEKHTASEAIEIIRQYEQEQQIQVGDEVITASGKAVVMGVGPVHFEYANADGSYGYDKVKNVKKTGRHFHEIAEVLQKMRDNN